MSQVKILLVDDEPQILKQFERALKRVSYEVDVAYSGEEGWEKYQQNYYDVIVVDWRMGKMSGMDLMREIDEKHPHPHTKMIMVTAYGDESTAIDAHHHHAFDYLKKPVDMVEFRKKIEEAVKRRDGIIESLEDWVETHPEEATRPHKATFDENGERQIWSAKEVLEEIRKNTDFGRREYQNIVKLTIDLLTRGKIK